MQKRIISYGKYIYLLLFIFLLSGLAHSLAFAEGTLNEADVAPKFHAPYPFTKDEFEERLVKIMGLLPDSASKDEVENILGMKFSETHPERPFYEAKDGLDWYFSVRLWKRKIQYDYIFKFMWEKTQDQLVSPPPENMCIKEHEFRLKLEKIGWIFINKRDYQFGTVGESRYKKLNSELLLIMDRSDRLTDCIHTIWVFYK